MTTGPQNLPRGEGPAVRSTCPSCGVGCGVILTPDGAGGLAVRGDAQHPASFGRLCSKGAALIEAKGRADPAFLAHVTGAEAAFATARATDPALAGISNSDLRAFIDLWCGTEMVVTVYSKGVNQSSHRTDNVNAIPNCHLATGWIGRPGMVPFSVTVRPNAMGVREVGGLANMLACHLDIENPAHRAAVQGFWQLPGIAKKPGLKAVDMFRAVADGRIKAIWIIHTNPIVSMRKVDLVAKALRACPVVVVQEMTSETDPARLAHVHLHLHLPVTAWAEKDGTVTNSERRISRQRAMRPTPRQARDDWRILADVAGRMG